MYVGYLFAEGVFDIAHSCSNRQGISIAVQLLYGQINGNTRDNVLLADNRHPNSTCLRKLQMSVLKQQQQQQINRNYKLILKL